MVSKQARRNSPTATSARNSPALIEIVHDPPFAPQSGNLGMPAVRRGGLGARLKPLSANDPEAIGPFRLRARLGSGGMGMVYLGFSPAGRPVAVKVVHPHLADDEEFVERFRREVEAASRVSGMYAAPVVASGVKDTPPWLATAYVAGPSLAALVDRHGPLPQEAVWRLAAGLSEALRHVHDAGLVHRDLKPGNVLIADDGPHVIDFGISRAFEGTQLTAAGILVGTLGYMSPEQMDGAQATPASDVFALGCVLAYAATGNPPFGAETYSSLLYQVANVEPDLDSVSPGLRAVIQACLRKAAQERPGLTDLAATIATAGPPAHETLGSFWPADVARHILSAQAMTTPDSESLPSAPPATTGPATTGPATTGPAPTGTAAAAPPNGQTTPVPAAPAVPRPQPAAAPLAIRRTSQLMGLGFAVTLTDLVFSILALDRYHDEAGHPASQMADSMVIAVAADLIGLAAWVWLAAACRRGAGWTRIAGTALATLYTACTLIVTLGTHNDPAPWSLTIAVWAIGLAATVLLWSRPANAFFGRPRNR